MESNTIIAIVSSCIAFISATTAIVAVRINSRNVKRQIQVSQENVNKQVETWKQNTNSQIRISKLEDLLECILKVGRYYGVLTELHHKLKQQRDPNDKEILTLQQYYKERESRMAESEWLVLRGLLSRIEVLASFYTKGTVKEKVLEYESMMFAFGELVQNGGSMYQEVHFKQGFPDYKETSDKIKELKDLLTSEIDL